MRTRVLLGTGALAGLLALGIGVAAAQDAPPEPADPLDGPRTIDVGGFELELLPDEPVQVCVLERTEAADGATVLAVTAYLTPHGPFAEAPRGLVAVGPLADAGPLECQGLSGTALE